MKIEARKFLHIAFGVSSSIVQRYIQGVGQLGLEPLDQRIMSPSQGITLNPPEYTRTSFSLEEVCDLIPFGSKRFL